MGSKQSPKAPDLDSDPYEDYEGYGDELDDDLGNIKDLSKDFYSTDWEDPSEPDYRFNTRRKIGRKKEHKNLYSELDDADELDFGNEW